METRILDWWVPIVEVYNSWVRGGAMNTLLLSKPEVPVLRRIAQKKGASQRIRKPDRD